MDTLLATQNRLEGLENQISTLEASVSDVDINTPTCPFCGSEQQVLLTLSALGHSIYKHCECDKMQKHLDRLQEISNLKADYDLTRELSSQRRAKISNLVKESGIGNRFASRTFDNFDRSLSPYAFDKCKSFAENFTENDGKGLVLTGNVGTGKTHLAAAIANYVMTELGLPVLFMTYQDILDQIRLTFSNESADSMWSKQKIFNVPLLVIDDLGKEKASEFTVATLNQIVNSRYVNNYPLIITTNSGYSELYSDLDYATFSRLAEMCEGVNFDGNDYRMRNHLVSNMYEIGTEM